MDMITFKVTRQTTIWEVAEFALDVPDYVKDVGVQKNLAEQYARTKTLDLVWTHKNVEVEVEDVERISPINSFDDIDWDAMARKE
jgi:hypothetical protein